MMWTSIALFTCSLCVISCLESNVIRSSKEVLEGPPQQQQQNSQMRVSVSAKEPQGNALLPILEEIGTPSRSEVVPDGGIVRGSGNARRRTEDSLNSNRRSTPCTTPDCSNMRDRCSNRAQRRGSSQDRHADRQRHRDRQTEGETDRLTEDVAEGNRTKAPEMANCVRSGDCDVGLCCVRYLTGKRCQKIPLEGDACLLRGRSKLRRNLERCDCASGLTCSSTSRAELSKAKGQGVCMPRQRQRKTRHSGKRRRTEERLGQC